MLAFVQLEVICGIILIAAFALTLPFHVLTVHYRQFAPLRDVQPLLCMLTHGGYFMFVVHFFFAWHHKNELCYELSAVQLLGNVLLYGCFLCKHFALHKRYRMVTTSLPTNIVFVLAAFPFLILCTYRVATREADDCPNVEGVAGGLGLLIAVIAFVFFVLKEHPSSHFIRAKNIELGVIVLCSAASIAHQWVDQDGFVVPVLFLVVMASNVSFLAYVLPPIRLALRHGNEFTDEQQRILNDSMYNGSNGHAVFDDDAQGCGDVCVTRLAACVRTILGCSDDGAASNSGDVHNSSTLSNSGAASPINGDSMRTTEQRLLANHGTTSDRLTSGSLSPARQRQELETQQELQELIGIVKDGDYYRLQKIMSRRGVALINLGDQNGRTPLHYAVRVGELNCIRYLHAMGADTNKFDNKGRAPLHDAVRCTSRPQSVDRCAIITEMLRSGAVVNLPTAHGHTALHYAVQAGLLGAINTLLRHDANPLFQHDKEDATLSWQQAHVTHCQTLGSEICRKSPLTLAVEIGNGPVVSSLLHHLKMSSKTRLNPDMRCVHGMTLLHIALCLGNSNVVQVLLTEGSCSPWSVNEETSMNAFHMAAMGDSALSVAHMFQHVGAPDLIPEETEYSSLVPDTEVFGASASGGSNGVVGSGTFIGSHRNVKKHTIGSGVEHMSLMPTASTSSIPPMSPAERPSRASSFFGQASRRVQYGCAAPVLGTTPQSMGFGEAMAIIREHVPHASAEFSKLDELEAATDRVVHALKQKSNVHEIERVNCAMLVIAKRLRLSSARTMSGMIMSTASFPGVGSCSQLPSMRQSADAKVVMQCIQDMLRRFDNVGMTPLHYAIQQQNVNLVHIFASYGAVASDAEAKAGGPSGGDDVRSPASGSSGSSPCPFNNATLCGGMPVGDRGCGRVASSPPSDDGDMTETAGAFIGSLQNNFSNKLPAAQPEAMDLEQLSIRSYARDVRRYVENESTQALLMQALRDGMDTFLRYHLEEREAS